MGDALRHFCPDGSRSLVINPGYISSCLQCLAPTAAPPHPLRTTPSAAKLHTPPRHGPSRTVFLILTMLLVSTQTTKQTRRSSMPSSTAFSRTICSRTSRTSVFVSSTSRPRKPISTRLTSLCSFVPSNPISRSTKPATSPPSTSSPPTRSTFYQISSPSAMPSIPPNLDASSSPSRIAVLCPA